MLLYLYDLIYIIPICLASLGFAFPYFGMDKMSIIACLIAIAVCVYFILLQYIKFRWKIITVIATILFVVCVFVTQKRDTVIKYFSENIWILWVMLLAFVAFVIGKLLMKFHVLRLFSVVLLFAGLILMMVFKVKVIKICPVLMFFLIVVILSEEIQRCWKKEGYTDSKKHLVFITPFLIVYLVAMFLIATPAEPYGWKITKTVVHKVKEGGQAIINLFVANDEGYGNYVTGFSSDGEIVDCLDESEITEVMKVKSLGDSGNKVYLVGKVFDTFDGRNWTVEYHGEEDDRMLDAMELYYGLYNYDPIGITNYIRVATLNIEYTDMKSKYIFAPSKSITEGAGLGEIKHYQDGGTLMAKKKKSGKLAYQVKYYRLNQNNDKLYEFLCSEHVENNSTWVDVQRRFGVLENDKYLFSLLLEHRKNIRENYSNEVTLSKELKAYMDDMLEGANSDYEKLERIESMFKDYTYSTHPIPLPEDVDTPEEFLDFFILESKEGFCIHYATAFTLIARAYGIPVRYVQGYYATVENNATSTILSSAAHAWPEAYIEGVGWMQFEPTPGYKVIEGWETRKIQSNNEEYVPLEVTASASDTYQEFLVDPDLNFQKNKFKFNPLMIIIPLVSCLVVFIIYLFMDTIVKKIRYNKMSDREKLGYMCRRNMNLLKRLGASLNQGETLEEFSARISKTMPKEVLYFIPDYEKLLYSDKEVSIKMREWAEASNRMLVNQMKDAKKLLFLWHYLGYKFSK